MDKCARVVDDRWACGVCVGGANVDKMSSLFCLLFSQVSKLTLAVKVLEARMDALDAEVGTLLEKERKRCLRDWPE